MLGGETGTDFTFVRGFPARNTRNENPRPFSNDSTVAVASRTG
jgi:hypothetical protein